jgi:alpha-L-rhamnosidase
VNPVGIDVAQPRLDWLLQSSIRGQKQTAYRVLVSSTPALAAARTGDLWDSGKVASDQSTQVVYLGKTLASRQTAWWQVQAWDKDGRASPWSATATWEVGLLAPSDWHASWISTPSPAFAATGLDWIWYPDPDLLSAAPAGTRWFRKTFTVADASAVQQATLAIAADNTYDVYVNGKRVSAGTEWSDAASIQVASCLVTGTNVLAVAADNATVSPAGLLAQLQIHTGAGSSVVSTDGTWVSTSGTPAPGWQTSSFDDSGWTPVAIAAAYGGGPWGTPAPGVGGAGPARYLRRSFPVHGQVLRARLYATALGLYDASINGQRIGLQHFAPGWTDYAARVQVETYDVTSALAGGENVVGLILGDGWYQGKVGYGGRGRYGPGPIAALAQLEIDLADGTHQVIATDGAWQATNGPIVANDLLDGEVYDARLEMPGWDAPGFAAGLWTAASVVTPASLGALVAQGDDGVQVESQRSPVTVVQPSPGVFVYDLGQNIVGWTRLEVTGQAGATIRLRFGEVLNPDGSLYAANMRGAAETDVYTLKGGAPESYEPRFASHGFRYVELSGDVAQLSAQPGLSTITGVVAHAATPPTGSLVTSDPNVNQLLSNIEWSAKDNFTAVPTDCPQRDERLGWMGDAEIFATTATLEMDVAAFYTKWLKDVRDAQGSNGAFSDVSPNPRSIAGAGTPAWGDAGVIVPWAVYLAYGDTRILKESYPAMKAWVDYIAASNPGYLWQSSRGSDYGDWLNVHAETDHEVLGTAFYAHSADIVSRAAAVLGNTTDATTYAQLFASIRNAFGTAYVSSDGHIRSDTQTAYVLALRFGLLTSAQQTQAAALLQANIASSHGYLTTGFVGVGHLLPALSAAGMTDAAYALLQNDGYPSWRYEIDRGATTVWERWDGIMPDGGFEDPGMNSFNHYSFGSVGEWMYETIGGLVLDEARPGWKSFRVRPVPGGGITSAKATLESPYGTIVSDWSIAGGTFTLSVTVPVNATATVYLPSSQNVTLDGSTPPAPGADGGYAIASGTYVFTSAAH